jgi:hypothetical protein
MGESLPFEAGAPQGAPGPQSGGPDFGVVGRLIGSLFAIAAAAAGLVLTLVVAAGLAVFTIIASMALALTGLAWRMGRRPTREDAPVLLDARKVGHAWVAYGWDEPRR